MLFHLLLQGKRWSQKIKASPNRSARLAAHAQQQSFLFTSFPYFVPSSLLPYCLQLFQNLMPFL
jgi:hypothetical protein